MCGKGQVGGRLAYEGVFQQREPMWGMIEDHFAEYNRQQLAERERKFQEAVRLRQLFISPSPVKIDLAKVRF